jgi:hypothetical protein
MMTRCVSELIVMLLALFSSRCLELVMPAL